MMIHTPGPWRTSGHLPGRIVADHPTGRPLEADPFTTEGGVLIPDDLQAYGGYMVCESVLPKDKARIAAAPEMFETLRLAEAWISGASGLTLQEVLRPIRDLISRIEEAEAEATSEEVEA